MTFVVLFAGYFQGEYVFLVEGCELVKLIQGGNNHPKYPNMVALPMVHLKSETGDHNIILILIL